MRQYIVGKCGKLYTHSREIASQRPRSLQAKKPWTGTDHWQCWKWGSLLGVTGTLLSTVNGWKREVTGHWNWEWGRTGKLLSYDDRNGSENDEVKAVKNSWGAEWVRKWFIAVQKIWSLSLSLTYIFLLVPSLLLLSASSHVFLAPSTATPPSTS